MKRTAVVTRGLLLIMAGGLAAFFAGAFFLAKGAGQDGRAVTLFVSGDTRGYLEPCGCRRDQSGGLPARLTLIRRDTTPDRLLLDVGNLTSGGRSYELLKLQFLLRGLKEIGYDAVNVGRREARLDRDTLAKIVAESPVPFLSCNVRDKQSGTLIARPYRVKSVAGVRVGVTGVTEIPDDEIGPGLEARPAAEALAETLPRLKNECDFIFVMAFASQETLREIANRFHEIQCLLGGDVPESSEKAEIVNRAILFNVTDKGKVLGKLSFRSGGGSLRLIDSVAFRVRDTLTPAPEMTRLLEEYRDALRSRNLELVSEEGLDPISVVKPTADTYAGQNACQSCHAQAHRIGVSAAHAHAYETLIRKKSEFDPECLRCHTVGFGARDGFLNTQKTPQLAGVQCESCHGRGSAHVQAASSSAGKASAFHPVTPNTCVRCHDKENSENFHFAAYWPRIRHGTK